MEKTSSLYCGKCVSYTHLGMGVFVTDQFPERILVSGMVPGDEGEVEISYKRAGNCFGKIKKLSVLSKDRVTPLCPVHTSCGGCLFQNVSYERQLAFKKDLVASQLGRVEGLSFEVSDPVASEPCLGVRNKVQVPFGRGRWGELIYGFYKELSHDIVPYPDCVNADPRANEILHKVKDAAVMAKISSYDEKSGRGELRHAVVRASRAYEEAMVTIVTKDKDFEGKDEIFKALAASLGPDDHLIHNVNGDKTNVILGAVEETIKGSPYLRDRILNREFLVSSRSFYQTNPYVTEKLYQSILDHIELTGEETVLDAYGGIGTIGLIVADKAKKVISVENVPEATEDAKKNAELNHVTNFEAVCSDVGDYLEVLAKNGGHIDVAVLDPARRGCGQRTMDQILSLAPSQIVYVSCSPMSLAKDLAVIKDHYFIRLVQPFDMFPYTPRVETLVVLNRK